jgi:lysophospholipase L1-like esterase
MSFKKIKIVALSFVFTCLSISVATAQIPPAHTPYLALGDSIAFGYNPQVKNWDLKKYIGYPVLLSSALHLDLTNASCPGETSGTFAGTSTEYLPGFDCQKFSDNHQLFVSYKKGSQLDYAIKYLQTHPKTSLVTINIGGNDLGLVQASCAGDAACELAQLPGALAAVGQNLDLIFADLRGTGYNGPIVALNYYAFNYLDPTQVAAFTALNTAIATTAALHNVAVADAYRAFFIASLLKKGDACAAGLLLRDPKTNTCDTHPSPVGQALLAATAVQAIPRH